MKKIYNITQPTNQDDAAESYPNEEVLRDQKILKQKLGLDTQSIEELKSKMDLENLDLNDDFNKQIAINNANNDPRKTSYARDSREVEVEGFSKAYQEALNIDREAFLDEVVDDPDLRADPERHQALANLTRNEDSFEE